MGWYKEKDAGCRLPVTRHGDDAWETGVVSSEELEPWAEGKVKQT